jgi:RNA polymerase sigma-70 factor (sigma-E family)
MEFEEFVRERLAVLLRYATVLACDRALAEDITQNVMIRAQIHWARVRAADQPEAYLKRMVLNELLSWRRRRQARVGRLSEELAPAADDPMAAIDARDALLREIAQLPPRQRAVIALSYYEDQTDSEIAAMLGCGEATVRSHRSRALLALRSSVAATFASGPPAPRRNRREQP